MLVVQFFKDVVTIGLVFVDFICRIIAINAKMKGVLFKQKLGEGRGLGVCNTIHRNGMLHFFLPSNCTFEIIRTTVVDIESPIYREFSFKSNANFSRIMGAFRNQFPFLAQFVSQNEYEKKNT